MKIWVDTGEGFRQLGARAVTEKMIVALASPGIEQLRRAEEALRLIHPSRDLQRAPPLVYSPDYAEKKRERKEKIEDVMYRARNPQGLVRERYQQRLGSDGTIPSNALIAAKEQIDKKRQRSMDLRDAGIWTWEWLGPGNIGGRIRAILIDPDNADKMWIGSVSGGIWKTVNGGGSWSPVDDFMANLNISSLVMDPTNTDVIYAGTGESFWNQDGLPGAGIFKSTDGGDTWLQLPDTATDDFRYVTRLAHHPTQANRIFAVTAIPERVWESTDGGDNWNEILTTASRALDIKIHPTQSDRILVGCINHVYYFDGMQWSNETTGGNQLPMNGGRSEVAFAPSNANVMYVSMDRNDGEIWQTTDGGGQWSLMSTGTNYLGGQGTYDNAIWVDPTQSNHIVVGGIKLWRSTTGGSSLTQISSGNYYNGTSAHDDQHIIVHHPDYDGSTNKTVFVGNDGGIQKAPDITAAGTSSGWTNLANNLGITQFYGGAAAPDGSIIVGGTQDNDKLHYTPSGGTGNWSLGSSHASWGDGGFAAVNYNDTSVLYGEYTVLAMFKSTDGGANYYRKTNGLTDHGTNALFIAPFAMDPNDPAVLIAGGGSIWKTIDSAENWSAIRGTVTGDPQCSAIDIAETNSNVIWVGYTDGHVAGTTSGGSSWTRFDNNPTALPNRYVTDIAINPFNSSEVFVTFGGYETDSVWYTSDGGANWVQRTGTAPYDLPAIQVNTIRFHPANANWVYIGTDLGIFSSENKGITWSTTPRYTQNEGPVNVEVSELVWQGGEYLIAVTHGRGMFRSRPLDVVFVDGGAASGGDGSYASPFRTITEAVNAAGHGTTISIEGGTYSETPLTLFKRGKIIITNGPVLVP